MANVKHIKIYSTTWCGFCKKEMAYLDENGIKYEDVLVDKDPAEAEKMIKLSGQQGVPFTVFTLEDGKEEYVLGFNKPKIDALLGLGV